MAIGIFLIHSYFGMAIGIPIDLMLSQSIPSTDHLQVVQKQQSQGRVGKCVKKTKSLEWISKDYCYISIVHYMAVIYPLSNTLKSFVFPADM